MKKLNSKLSSRRGASISFALLMFLVCSVISSVVIVAATAAAGRMSQTAEMDQRYYAVTSAAGLLADALDGQTVTFQTVTEENIKTVTNYTVGGDGATIATTEGPVTQVTGKRISMNPDGVIMLIYNQTMETGSTDSQLEPEASVAPLSLGISVTDGAALTIFSNLVTTPDLSSLATNYGEGRQLDLSVETDDTVVVGETSTSVDLSALSVTVLENLEIVGDNCVHSFIVYKSKAGADGKDMSYALQVTFNVTVERQDPQVSTADATEYTTSDPDRTPDSGDEIVTGSTLTTTRTTTETVTMTWSLDSIRKPKPSNE